MPRFADRPAHLDVSRRERQILDVLFARGRSTGKFIGLTGEGLVANSPGGAEIIEFGFSDYSAYAEPV